MKTTIQKVREWIILVLGIVLMVFSGFLLYVDYNDIWKDEIGERWIFGIFFLGIIMLAQPRRLGDFLGKIGDFFSTQKQKKG